MPNASSFERIPAKRQGLLESQLHAVRAASGTVREHYRAILTSCVAASEKFGAWRYVAPCQSFVSFSVRPLHLSLLALAIQTEPRVIAE